MHIKRERIITMCRHINITTTVITVRITDIVNVIPASISLGESASLLISMPASLLTSIQCCHL
ncbi:hypothetical protein BO70DRAFT_367219, partial [Aspergillus heteromorphus CBS 117.55]